MTYRIVYMGTPEFACPALTALTRVPDVEVVLVVTQPDRPAGRGRKLQSPPVKQCAQALGLPVYQVTSLRSVSARQPIVESAPDLIVVAAFGLILGRAMLELPKHGCVNLHASLLPRYRGASPIAAAILNGDRESGVTIMKMASGLDTGPMYAAARLSIDPDDTTVSLTRKLASASAQLISENILSILHNQLHLVEQDEHHATLTRPLVKADGWVDWNRPATHIERQTRAMWDWPRVWTNTPANILFQIHEAKALSTPSTASAGVVSITGEGLVVGCGEGSLLIRRGQLAGKTAMDSSQLARLPIFADGVRLGDTVAPISPGPMIRSVRSGE